ncbi:anti-sigma factor antagonist [Streptomyces sp. NPDC002845]
MTLNPATEEPVGGDVVVSHDPAPLTRHLRVRQERGQTVLEFHGEIDIIAALEIIPYLDSVTGRPEPQIVIDLRPVEFFDCSGLRLLFRARHRILARGGRLHLLCTQDLTLRILHVSGLAHHLPPSASLEEALSRPEATSGSL